MKYSLEVEVEEIDGHLYCDGRCPFLNDMRWSKAQCLLFKEELSVESVCYNSRAKICYVCKKVISKKNEG